MRQKLLYHGEFKVPQLSYKWKTLIRQCRTIRTVFEQSLNVRNTYNSFTIFIQTLNVYKSGLGWSYTKKLWLYPKGKKTSLFWVYLLFEWYKDIILFGAFFLFLFLLRTNSSKGHFDENDFRHYDNFFESAILKVTSSLLLSYSSFSTVRGHIANYLLKICQNTALHNPYFAS